MTRPQPSGTKDEGSVSLNSKLNSAVMTPDDGSRKETSGGEQGVQNSRASHGSQQEGRVVKAARPTYVSREGDARRELWRQDQQPQERRPTARLKIEAIDADFEKAGHHSRPG